MSARTLAIGDIHGQLAQFDALLAAVALKPEDHLVLLGDYVDRGPDSAGVLKRIIQLKARGNVTAVRGNHEQMMLGAKEGRIEALREWALNGGFETLQSYGMRATVKEVPSEHWRFLEKDLVDYLETNTHIFVHASCYPDYPMSEQPDYMLRWERCDEIRPHESGKVIVCGHTPQPRGTPMNKGFAICLDTGAGHGGPLTCLDVHSGKFWQADSQQKLTRGHISDCSD